MMTWIIDHPRGALTLIILGVVAYYAFQCWWFPFGRCWCCKGKGIHMAADGKHFRDCKWMCKGKGRRRRVGRAIFEWTRKVIKNVA